ASKVELMITTKNLVTETTGAAEVKLSGKVDYHRAEVSGAANLKAWELETNKANIEVSGAASAKLSVSEELTGETSGMGKITLKQEPKVKNVERSGVSKVITDEEDTATTKEGVTTIKVGDREITIDDENVTMAGDSGTNENMVINDEGVRIVLKEKNENGKIETKELVIDDKGMRIINKEKNETERVIKKAKKHKFDGHWEGFELGVNGFVDPYNKMDLPAKYEYLDLKMSKSINVKINFLEQNINLINNHLGLVTGLGLEYVNYRFAGNVRLDPDTTILYGFRDYSTNSKKSKLVVNYLNVPLLLEYQTNAKDKSNSFHLAGGMTFGLRIGSHTKVVSGDNDEKKKQRDDFALNPFKWDATARIGWGIINLAATYSMTSLFKTDKGPELYPFSVGITLTDF
ncbi:MAG: outer membrane beta-barrel protein, partial [Bacteroidetes bacterium]|nr:outer membrane beta-barrel protein [Bacteroidota bacterium]